MVRGARLWWGAGGLVVLLVLVAAVLLARPEPGSPATTGSATTGSATARSATASPATSRTEGATAPRRPESAVERRGCGWFVAYEPGVMDALDVDVSRSRLNRSQEEVLHGAMSGDMAELRAGLLGGAGGDVIVPGFEYTPLAGAVASRCGEAVRLLLASGAHPELAAPGGNPPLLLAVLVADEQLVTALLRAGADPDTPAPDGTTARATAAALDDLAVLRALAGGDPQSAVPDPGGATGDA